LMKQRRDVLPPFLRENSRFERVVRESLPPVPTREQLTAFLQCVIGFSSNLSERKSRLKDRAKGAETARIWPLTPPQQAGDCSELDDDDDDDDDDKESNAVAWPNDHECIAWTGPTRARGTRTLPTFYMNCQRYSARMLMYAWFVDDVSKRRCLGVHTTCGGALCINPAHLVLKPRGHRASRMRQTAARAPFSWDAEVAWPADIDWPPLEAGPEPAAVAMGPGCASPWNTPPPSPAWQDPPCPVVELNVLKSGGSDDSNEWGKTKSRWNSLANFAEPSQLPCALPNFTPHVAEQTAWEPDVFVVPFGHFHRLSSYYKRPFGIS